jgi:phosphatidylserine/phosphatidylglycerophosphate/cardiolipin synthase-like enzyme
MKFKLLFTLAMLTTVMVNAQTLITIAAARALDTTNSVTVKGIVTCGSELGAARYMQDATGGIVAYSPTALTNVKRGDSIQVSGHLANYRDLIEITPITNVTVLNSNNTVPDPLVITPAQFNVTNQGKLVKFLNGTFALSGTFAGNTNYAFNTGGAIVQVRTSTGTSNVGRPIPTSPVNLIGEASVFAGTYQLLLRDTNDIENLAALFFTSAPFVTQTNITNVGFNVTWTTNIGSSTKLIYGTSPTALNQTIDLGGSTVAHTVSLTGLVPARVYYVQAISVAGGNTASSPITPMITASNSTGETRIYFNHVNQGSFSQGGALPNGITGAVCEMAIVDRINAAKSTIDVAMYNTSDAAIINALVAAAGRGVRVRYITDKNTSNTTLPAVTAFRILKSDNNALMHNKFFAIDADSVNTSWSLSGSMNNTTAQVLTDFNNLILFQDQSLTRVYVMEFEEMWASNTAIPGTAIKFSSNKTDNTPHKFIVGGKAIELYFSPTDQTTNAIVNAVNSSNTDLEFALLTFTRTDISAAIKAAKDRSVSCRGIIDNVNDTGSQTAYLTTNNVPWKQYLSSYQFHHKYVVVDATNPASDPIVGTGSHNWSSAAETANDENYLIIHSAKTANIFLQEFEARWCELTAGCVVGTSESKAIEGFSFNVYPNPTADLVRIDLNSDIYSEVAVTIYNALGQAIQSNIYNDIKGKTTKEISLTGLPSGQYFISFSIDNQRVATRLQIVK